MYLARRNKPSSKYSSAVTHLSESLYPQQYFIVTIKDREWYEYELGTFYLCAEAFDAYSAYASVHDFRSEGIFNGDEKIEYHMHLHRDDAVQMRFTRDELLDTDVTVKF